MEEKKSVDKIQFNPPDVEYFKANFERLKKESEDYAKEIRESKKISIESLFRFFN